MKDVSPAPHGLLADDELRFAVEGHFDALSHVRQIVAALQAQCSESPDVNSAIKLRVACATLAALEVRLQQAAERWNRAVLLMQLHGQTTH